MFQNSPTCSKVIWGNEQKKICAMQLPRAQALLWKEISAKFPNSVNNYKQFEANNFYNKINQQSKFEIFITFTPQIFFLTIRALMKWKDPWARSVSYARFCHLPRKESLLKGNYICLTFFTSKHCQRHNGTKALSTLTHSTPLVQSRSFNKFSILGQIWAWVLVGKGQEIHSTTLTNPSNNFDKSE